MVKIRLGFVSNSSSSSFLVAFPKKPNNADELKAMLFTKYQCDIENSQRMDDVSSYLFDKICEFLDINRKKKDLRKFVINEWEKHPDPDIWCEKKKEVDQEWEHEHGKRFVCDCNDPESRKELDKIHKETDRRAKIWSDCDVEEFEENTRGWFVCTFELGNATFDTASLCEELEHSGVFNHLPHIIHNNH